MLTNTQIYKIAYAASVLSLAGKLDPETAFHHPAAEYIRDQILLAPRAGDVSAICKAVYERGPVTAENRDAILRSVMTDYTEVDADDLDQREIDMHKAKLAGIDLGDIEREDLDWRDFQPADHAGTMIERKFPKSGGDQIVVGVVFDHLELPMEGGIEIDVPTVYVRNVGKEWDEGVLLPGCKTLAQLDALIGMATPAELKKED